MNQFLVNGVQTELPLPETGALSDLLHHVRSHWVTETTLISSLRINGQELSAEQEEVLASTQLSQIESLEISTAHPRDAAHETLEMLIPFIESLEGLSIQTGNCAQPAEFFPLFYRLVDGISTMTEAILTVRRVLRVGILQTVQILEADLLSILKDLTEAQERKDSAYVSQLLLEHLPQNLKEWREDGIPALVRSRDS